jgi:hypothetical protein
MNGLKLIGIVALLLWMAWVSLQLVNIKQIALEACGIASIGGQDKNGGIKLPVTCPDLDRNEVKYQTK